MTIKKRIMRSNIQMILIPTVLIVIISAVVYISYVKIYSGFDNIIDNDSKEILQARQLVKTVSNQMEYSQDADTAEKFQQELAQELRVLGYDLKIENQTGIAFSNFRRESKDAFDEIAVSNASGPDFFTLESEHASFIQKKIFIDNEAYYIQAINPDYAPSNVDFEKQMMAASHYAIIILVISFIIILVTNGVISANVAKRLIAPLDLLSYGAKQIKEGNLDFEIRYDDKDEFGEVCEEFNQMRTRLKKSIQSQMKYEEDRKELIAGISHDLRTPLTSIKGYVKGIQDGVANTPEKLAHYLDITYMQACNMDKLVDKLFLFSTLDTGRFPFRFEIVDCDDYLKHFTQTAGKEYENNGLEVTFENRNKEPVYVRMDTGEMSRVIGNILDNSVKYNNADKKAVKIALTCLKKENTNDEFAVIEVEDNGDGVAEKHIPNLFKTFYRADPSRTDAGRSSGLGLSIADRIISAHGGTISAENRKGLCIIIKLPAVYPEPSDL